MNRTVWSLTLSLASLAGCAGAPASPGPGSVAAVPVGHGIERLPPISAPPPPLPAIPPPPTAKKSFWQCLWPWDDERDARPKTQREIDDDFKWRNNG